ncbi:hypothetical protein ACB094_11G051200 [Castanea mollissima]
MLSHVLKFPISGLSAAIKCCHHGFSINPQLKSDRGRNLNFMLSFVGGNISFHAFSSGRLKHPITRLGLALISSIPTAGISTITSSSMITHYGWTRAGEEEQPVWVLDAIRRGIRNRRQFGNKRKLHCISFYGATRLVEKSPSSCLIFFTLNKRIRIPIWGWVL